jgi:very-short-patch-repair endonuclease
LRKRLVRLQELQVAVHALPPGPGRKRFERVVEGVDPKAGSVLESLLRVLLGDHGLLPPQTQYRFENAARDFIGRLDFAWPDLCLALETEGFEFHSRRAEHRLDCQRHNALASQGWWLLRFTWDDVVFHPDEVVATVADTLRVLRLKANAASATTNTQRLSEPLVTSVLRF